jgi:uncharacterized membrane protein
MRKLELLIIIGLTTTHIFLSFYEIIGPLRVATGFVFLTILPGYVLLTFFYQTNLEDHRFLFHLVLSIPVSLAITSTLGLLTNVLSLSLEIIPSLIWLSIFILLLAFLSFFRTSNMRTQNLKLNRFILITGLLVVLFAVNISLSSANENSESDFLGLYLLDNKSLTENYPSRAQAGIPFELLLCVEYEGRSEQKFILTSTQGSMVSFSLSPGETWTEVVEVTMNEPGMHKVAWTLYKVGRNSPQREVRLWVTAY